MTVSPDEQHTASAGTSPVSDVSASSPTEQRNPRTTGIDLLPTRAILGLLNAEDDLVPGVVRRSLGPLAAVVDEAADRIRRGGRVHYFGAGSSGRIAVLDAAELIPTFGLVPGTVTAHLAGGPGAMEHPAEGAEDDEAGGTADAGQVSAADLVIGLSASGRTPYVAGALRAASARGAFTAVVTCNPRSPLLPLARAAVLAGTGPEAIAGSTRLKATSALKLILNGFSTALMIRLGKTYSNLMVEVSATNSKLRGRTVRMLMDASGAGEADCTAALARAGGDVRLAMVTLLGGAGLPAARQALAAGGGSVRGALTALGSAPARPQPGRGRLMAAEMREQPAVLRALAARAAEVGQLAAGAGQPPAGVVIFGQGPSGTAARYGSRLLRAVTGRPASLLCLDDAPAAGGDPEQGYRGYLAIAVSRSGRAPAAVAALERLQRAGAHGIAVTNDTGSPLAAAAHAVIGLAAGPERARPATKTVTAQLLALALLARALNPRAIDLGVLAAVADQVEEALGDGPAAAAAEALSGARGAACLASGLLRAAAGATARTLTETVSLLTAVHPPGEFPAAALAPGLAVLAFGGDQDDDRLAALGSEASRRGAAWSEVSPRPAAAVPLPAGLPGYALPLVAAVRGQQLAWAAAMLAGRDPDGASQPITIL